VGQNAESVTGTALRLSWLAAGHSLLAPELTLLLPLARFLGLTWLIIVGMVLSGPGRAEQDRDHGMNR
jgi:hypothetical protein